MLTTAKSEKVYSPAELAAKPIGTKPAMVTSVPASIAIAYCLKAIGRGLHLFVAGGEPGHHRVRRRHGVVDEQRERDDQRAERNALHVDARDDMPAKTIASVSGIESATTRPARTPRLMKLTTRMMATDCHSEVMKSAIA